MGTAAYFDCFSGISGDMTLGALMDLGVPEDHLQKGLQGFLIQGYTLRVSRQKRGMIEGTRIEVLVDSGKQSHRTFGQIDEMLSLAGLPEKVIWRAREIFTRLAQAESRIHGKPVDQVHFHEIGAVDSIVDIVGTALGIEYLNIDHTYVSPLALGTGFVHCQHGILPVPAPATLEILRGMRTRFTQIECELVTPTGAAIAASLAGQGHPEVPPLRIHRVGYGVGTHELPHPNLLRIILGETIREYEEDEVIELECHIDNLNPEIYEHVMERLFAAGALDVSLTPLQMKKGRPGILLRVLAEPGNKATMISIIFEETTTLGIRVHDVQRVKLARRNEIVETAYGPVKVKVIRGRGCQVAEYRPEYEECRRIAQREGIPLRKVYELLHQTLHARPVSE